MKVAAGRFGINTRIFDDEGVDITHSVPIAALDIRVALAEPSMARATIVLEQVEVEVDRVAWAVRMPDGRVIQVDTIRTKDGGLYDFRGRTPRFVPGEG